MTQFAFFTCQVGAENALKAELGGARPDWRLAFSRPGFLTFKTSRDAADELGDFAAPTFARAWGESLGKVSAEAIDEGTIDRTAINQTAIDQMAAKVWRLVDPVQFDRLHVWQRDMQPTGRHGFEPLPTALAVEAQAALHAALIGDGRALRHGISDPAAPAAVASDYPAAELSTPGQRVLDCVIVEPDQWWIGSHLADDNPASCWVGGVPKIELPAETVSRAYAKMEEALRWSRLPCRAGQHWAEIGCAPGGASQALLNRGMTVLGIDPAEVDPRLADEARFTHLRMRAADARRRAFRAVRWLAADVNVAPEYTLDAVEAIVIHPAVAIDGLLLTLKLLDWSLAEKLPEYLERIRSWGYTQIQSRQLAFNRQEVCVAAMLPPRRRAPDPERAKQRRTPSRLKQRRKRLD